MKESEPLFFQDVMAEIGADQCGGCGAYADCDDMVRVQIDAPGHWVNLCLDCQMGMEDA